MSEREKGRPRHWPDESWEVRGDGQVWIDHQVIKTEDLSALEPTTSLTMWNVKVPPGFYSALPHLEFLDLRGGTAENLDPITEARGLRALVVNQVRGIADLDAIAAMTSLRYLELYGLRHVARLPSLAALTQLKRVNLGQMQSLSDIAGVADAPALEALVLLKKLAIDAESMRPFRAHPSLRAFTWLWEDVPWKQAEPVLAALPLPKVEPLRVDQWLAAHPLH